MRVDTLDMPLMVAEPAHVRPEQRERLVQLLFETFRPPALFLAKANVLASFAVGRPTSLVIDCGASGVRRRQEDEGDGGDVSVVGLRHAGDPSWACVLSLSSDPPSFHALDCLCASSLKARWCLPSTTAIR
jgi:hypothetical protein